ncbi:kinase-like domain-containing protein [Lentinula aciculospora]|uniref:Kinase-like domain-containing protein n=1 Tax=Lentinula aciculospora TaxID=153920 RepID=A0A9W9DYZ1_9AGAR|nr:kinase-like domain-containing protein [Lentinula aciculospora]
MQENFTSQYRRKCLKALRLLAKTFRVLPNSFYIQDAVSVGTHAVSGGGFADIWRGSSNNMDVCLKVLRIFTSDGDASQRVLKEFCEEALVWKQLDHPNVLPFIGVNEVLFYPSYCFISPWMKNGNIMAYLDKHPEQDRLPLISQVADGLQYLHGLDPPIIHGDIRGANILITDDFHCCLADFGLALVTESPSLHEKSLTLRGSVRWMAPEILDPSLSHLIQPRARDIYAFGCTVVEILSEKPPFPNIKYDVAVISQVLRGFQPEIPASLTEMSADLSELIYSCWDPVPFRRPTADDISCFLSFYIVKESCELVPGDFCTWLAGSLII